MHKLIHRLNEIIKLADEGDDSVGLGAYYDASNYRELIQAVKSLKTSDSVGMKLPQVEITITKGSDDTYKAVVERIPEYANDSYADDSYIEEYPNLDYDGVVFLIKTETNSFGK